VIVTHAGRSVLIDLGSARSDDGTSTATVSGVLGFICPDWLHGPGDAAADRWGLGMLTVFALLGHSQGSGALSQIEAELSAVLGGIGHRRRAVRHLLAMIDRDPDRRPTDPVAWADDLNACLTRRPRRLWIVPAAVAAGAAGVSAGLVAWTVVDDTPPPGTSEEAECPDRRTTDPELDRAQSDLVAKLAGDSCLAGPAEPYVKAVVQPLATLDGRPDGVVLVPPEGSALRLTEAIWSSYKEIAGRSVPENSAVYGGYPVEVEHLDERDAVRVRLDKSGMLLGPRDDTQLFWLPSQVLDLWESNGGLSGKLGFPTSNPYYDDKGLHLDFEHGAMHAYGDAAYVAGIVSGGPVSAVVELHDPGDDGALPATGLDEAIVRQLNGTAWWVDDDRVRHWIPDGATWTCLGGDDSVAADNLHGWEIAALPLGPPAHC
jgi:hypothetical protein